MTKTSDHYVLFGKGNVPGTTTNLLVSIDYLLAFMPAFGFSVGDASSAKRVTIIGGESYVSTEDASRLEASGSEVERLAGSAEEIADRLRKRVEARDPFAA